MDLIISLTVRNFSDEEYATRHDVISTLTAHLYNYSACDKLPFPI